MGALLTHLQAWHLIVLLNWQHRPMALLTRQQFHLAAGIAIHLLNHPNPIGTQYLRRAATLLQLCKQLSLRELAARVRKNLTTSGQGQRTEWMGSREYHQHQLRVVHQYLRHARPPFRSALNHTRPRRAKLMITLQVPPFPLLLFRLIHVPSVQAFHAHQPHRYFCP